MSLPHLETALDRLLSTVSPTVGRILDRALAGADITVDEATRLFDADGSDLLATMAAADHLRAMTVGDVITYVVNRNINFTNVCVKACGFCAFSRGHLAEEGSYLPRKSSGAQPKPATWVPPKSAFKRVSLPVWTAGTMSTFVAR